MMAPGPLAGTRVADLSRVLAGPYCSMLLADMGAEVIKVEPPDGDDTRAWGPPFIEGQSAYFLSINRGKRSVVLDLKSEEGKALLWRLLERCDVLLENFRPGAMDRLGFGVAAVASRLPRLVYCSISGFGHTGPDHALPGYDVLVQGESGLMSLTGEESGPAFKLGVSISDLTAGMMACQAILAALLHRERTGEGQHLDVAMLDVSASLLTFQAGIYFATGKAPRRRGNAHPTIAPYSTYECADGTLIVAVGNDNLFQRFCQAIELPDLASDDRFALAAARVENRVALDELLVPVLRGKGRDAWIAQLRRLGVPCGAVRDLAEVCESPHLRARGMLQEMEHPRAGRIRQLGPAATLSRSPWSLQRPPPLLGEHSDEILRELGLDAAEVMRLRAARVVF
jgi:formyl-CoA transferase/CoA:oxalate CoA-transferase